MSGLTINSGPVGNISYNALPMEAEQASKVQERDDRIRERFATGDTGGSIRRLTPEEAVQRRMESSAKPITLSVSADEIINNRFSETSANTTYEIEGVLFSNSEMSGLKAIAKSAVSMLPAIGSDLDYNAHASIGLAVNMVRTYAADHLSEKQSAVAVKRMENYIGRMEAAQQGNNHQADRTYYGAKRTVTEAAADSLRRKIATLPGDYSTLLKNVSDAQANSSLTAAAINGDLSSGIRKDFSTVDLRDKASVKALFESYRNKVTPAYREWGLDNKGHDTTLASKLKNDTDLFSDQIAGILSLLDRANGITVDYHA